MSKPVKHYGAYRIRWIDTEGKRQSETHETFSVAQRRLREHEVEEDQIRRGLRDATPLDKTFNDLANYWLERRAPLKRSGKDDESIIRKHLRPVFGQMKLRAIGAEDVDIYVLEKLQLDDAKDYGDAKAVGEKTRARAVSFGPDPFQTQSQRSARSPRTARHHRRATARRCSNRHAR